MVGESRRNAAIRDGDRGSRCGDDVTRQKSYRSALSSSLIHIHISHLPAYALQFRFSLHWFLPSLSLYISICIPGLAAITIRPSRRGARPGGPVSAAGGGGWPRLTGRHRCRQPSSIARRRRYVRLVTFVFSPAASRCGPAERASCRLFS